LIPKFASEVPQALANFGIGALVTMTGRKQSFNCRARISRSPRWMFGDSDIEKSRRRSGNDVGGA
jgi:hypothetical protein